MIFNIKICGSASIRDVFCSALLQKSNICFFDYLSDK